MIPPHLASTVALLQRAFPEGIDDASYLHVIHVLYEYMADGNLAEVMSIVTGRDVGETLNDVWRSEADSYSPNGLDAVFARLVAAGFIAWAEEE